MMHLIKNEGDDKYYCVQYHPPGRGLEVCDGCAFDVLNKRACPAVESEHSKLGACKVCELIDKAPGNQRVVCVLVPIDQLQADILLASGGAMIIGDDKWMEGIIKRMTNEPVSER
jgi:hypothetical protein